jgi:hypothetical protein
MTRGQVHFRNVLSAAGAICLLSASLWAQGRGGAQPPKTPKDAAPVDLTGYWVSVVTEDWRYRMFTPPKGDFASIPLSPEGVKVANAWDRAKDIASGEQCRAFGAAGIMRMPVRLHITWQDATTLKIEIDNGNQVRLLHFDKSTPPAKPEWQGVSSALWETVGEGQDLVPPAPGGRIPSGASMSGSLKVLTNRMRPGYLRRNGVPYSDNARMTEFFDRTAAPNGDTWLILTSILDDPQYLTQPFILTTQYKLESDRSKFAVRPCEETEPLK